MAVASEHEHPSATGRFGQYVGGGSGQHLPDEADMGSSVGECAVDLTGRNALGKGALSSADGMLYCLDENNGTVVLAEASPRAWKEHGRFKLDPQSKIRDSQGRVWTHPVISNGRLYLRDQDLIYCYDVKKS